MSTLTIDPDPPVQGRNATISTTPNEKLTFDWDPQGEPTERTTDSRGRLTITIPANASSVIITDSFGTDYAFTVSSS